MSNIDTIHVQSSKLSESLLEMLKLSDLLDSEMEVLTGGAADVIQRITFQDDGQVDEIVTEPVS